MSLLSRLAALMALGCTTAAFGSSGVLRVCADPNNLPFSNRAGQGFENQLASMVAKDLGMTIAYYWFPQRSAFFQKTLNAGRCDVVMGVPAKIPVASTTIPYYRSTYVFVSQRKRHLNISSLDDPRLRSLKIGVHITGDEDSNLPPVNALIQRGMAQNLVGYDIYGKLGEKNPPSDLIKAVAAGKVDVAIAWGPMAGYFAKASSVPLSVTPINPVLTNAITPMSFAISMGVRRGNGELRQTLDAEIERHEPEIRRLLKSYGVPLESAPAQAQQGD